MRNCVIRAALLSSATLLISPAMAVAQTAEPQAAAAAEVNPADIIVTARRRSESLIEVPVAIAAVSSLELSRSAINGIDALARKVPGFVVGEGGGTLQGGTLALRGISSADGNPLGDQAVSFNIDGVQVARSSIRRMGDFDTNGVQVLKGPQSLFFGKNSPGGIVSITTNDPGDRFEAGGHIGYEGNAKEWRGDGYVSGPLADGLGARLAFFGSSMKGWVDNLVPANDPFAPGSRTSPNSDEWAVRGTLKFDQGGPFNARLKVSYNRLKDNGITNNYQLVDCPSGAPQVGGINDCKGDDKIVYAGLGPVFGQLVANGTTVPPAPPGLPYSTFGDGTTRSTSKQLLTGLEMNYNLAPSLDLTSVTGLYKFDYLNVSNFSATNVPSAIYATGWGLKIREISQEIRLASSFDGPLNFLAGGQYQDTKGSTPLVAIIGAIPGQPTFLGPTRLAPFVATSSRFDQKGSAYSFFGQLQFKPIPELELAAGGRYSHERKELTSVILRGNQLVNVAPVLSNGRNKVSFNNFSPEVSISYRPTRDLNFYGNYKHGFLSGGFNTGSANAASPSFSYLPEKVKGFEAGFKGRFLDGMVNIDLAAYSYKITNLQVQASLAGIQVLQNAGSVSSKGVELSLSVAPTQGLSVYGNVAYQHGRYDQYFANCYTGQAALSPGLGIGQCGIQATPNDPSGTNRYQNLAGTELIRSPKWTGNAGVNYETPLSGDLKLDISPSVTFSSSYVTGATSQPRSRSPKYALLNTTVRLSQTDDRWEVAFIGNNLTNKFYWARTNDAQWGIGTPSQLADTNGVPSRGRELWIRVGFKY